MDSGSFFRRGSSVTSTLSVSGRQGYSPLSSSTPNTSLNATFCSPHSQVDVDPRIGNTSVSQKLDQLLFLFHEQKAENGELRKEVTALKEHVATLTQKRGEEQRCQNDCVGRNKSFKLSPELSVG